MLSKLTFLVLVLFPLVSCGSYEDDDQERGVVGRKPEFYSASYLWRGGDSNLVTAIDREGKTLQKFAVEPFQHLISIPLPLNYEKQGIIASADGGYYITIGETEYAVIRSDGTSTINPVELLGTIVSVAYDPDSNLAVLFDDFQSAALLSFDATGNVIDSTKLGPPDPSKTMLAGTMLSGGRLAISQTDDPNLYIYEIGTSISSRTWQRLPPKPVADAASMSWIASVPDQPDVVLIADKTRLVSYNVATGAVLSTKDLATTTVRGYFLDYNPHVITQTSGQSAEAISDVTYIDLSGQFTSKALRSSSKRVSHTWLDIQNDLFTVAFDPDNDYYSSYYDEDQIYRRHDLYRFRVSDSLALDRTEIDDAVSLIATPTAAVLLYPSALGKAQRRTYGRSPNVQTVEGYNLDLVRKRYKD